MELELMCGFLDGPNIKRAKEVLTCARFFISIRESESEFFQNL